MQMNYRTLFKRSFGNWPFLLSAVFITVFAGVLACLSLGEDEGMPMEIAGMVCVLGSAFLGWGIGSIIKADTCRKSTLVIPNFRKRLTAFYISFGIVLIFILSLATFFRSDIGTEKSGMDFYFFTVLGLGLLAYSISLFVSHFAPHWIVFTWFLLQIPRIFNIQFPDQFDLYMTISFYLAASILILLYRQAIIHITEESAFFRAPSFPENFNIRSLLRKTKSAYSRKSFWTNGYRSTFEFFLNFLHYLNIPRGTRIFVARILKNHIAWLSFRTLLFFIIFFVFIKPIPMYFILFPALVVWNVLLLANKNLQTDAIKPISRRRLFLTDYAGNYLSVMVLMFIILIGTKMPDTISGKLFPQYAKIWPNEPLLPYVFGGLFVASLELLAINRFRRSFGTNYLILILSVAVVSGVVPAVVRAVGAITLPLILLALTVLFTALSFRLDLKKDIA